MTVDIKALTDFLNNELRIVRRDGGSIQISDYAAVMMLESLSQLEAAQARIAELESEKTLSPTKKMTAVADLFVIPSKTGVGSYYVTDPAEALRISKWNDNVGISQYVTLSRYQDAYTAPPKPVIKLPDYIQRISESLKTQDNRITDQPMFVVFEKREIIGSDEHSPSRIVWCLDGEEVSELRAKRLEALHQDCRDTRGCYRYAMQEIDVFVTACFTEQGCKDYLSINGHNLRSPYIFASGSYRNNEYQQVRNWIISGCTAEGE